MTLLSPNDSVGCWIESNCKIKLIFAQGGQEEPSFFLFSRLTNKKSLIMAEKSPICSTIACNPFLLLAHKLIGIQQSLIVYDSTVT